MVHCFTEINYLALLCNYLASLVSGLIDPEINLIKVSRFSN